MTPTRVVGIGAESSLKVAFWNSTRPELEAAGDPDFFSIVLHVSGGRIRRLGHPNHGEPGSVGMQPFEGAKWLYEGPVSYLPVYMPFGLLASVSEGLFERELRHEQLSIPPGTRDQRLCAAMRAIRVGCLSTIEPTNLMLDSWALILSEIVVRRFSSHSGRHDRSSHGRILPRGVALAVDFIEANLHQDLRLASIANASAMSTYHFARSFKETVGMSPHAYVLARRVRRAQEMLDHDGRELTHVAAACGFSSQAHLTTAFRRRLGVTPGGYRRTASS